MRLNSRPTSTVLSASLFAWIIGIGVAGSAAADGSSAGPKFGRAMIQTCSGVDLDISGVGILREEPSDEGVKKVSVRLLVRGLPAGKHAVHIHENGTCTPTCGDAGGHFDPGPSECVGGANANGKCSTPDANHPYHMGDLINIESKGEDSVSVMNTETSRITLDEGPLGIFQAHTNDASAGSTFIIHTLPDTYCPDGTLVDLGEDARACAGGSRIACGVIQPVNFDPESDCQGPSCIP